MASSNCCMGIYQFDDEKRRILIKDENDWKIKLDNVTTL